MAISTPRKVVLTVLVGLIAVGAWFVIAIYPGELLRTATAHASSLCNALANEHDCPPNLAKFAGRLGTNDPWDHELKCRAVGGRVQIYSLGADNKAGGTKADSDVICTRELSRLHPDVDNFCSCEIESDPEAR